MKLFLLLISLLSGGVLLHASTTPESNSTEMIQADSVNEKNMTELPKKQHIVSRMQHIQAEIDQIDSDILEKSVLTKIYSNYNMFQELQKQHSVMEKDISKLQETKRLNFAQKEELEQLIQQRNTLEGKLTLLAEYEKDPFKKFLEPPKIEEVPSVGNPFAIIGAISYQDKLISNQDEYLGRFEKLEDIMDKLEDKEQMVEKLYTLSGGEEKYQTLLYDIREEIKTFQSVMEIFQTTLNVYTKKVEEIKLELSRTITEESKKTAYIGGFLLFLLILLLFVKYLVKRYMSDMDRYYTINKAINLTFFIFVVLTLLFAYIQNVSYLVTILGFASAGIAIAMKDWFMSVMGWFVIVIGGAIHVGDRIRVVRDGVEYVGDVVDISLLRMTVHEDVTLTTYLVNRRAGRIVFVPNNYIFTEMISNYSHAGLKTVWDGIDFFVTFDSDYKKASTIAKETAKKYSKGYTDITRKQLNKLRSQYHMKNTNVEPRIFTLIEPYGMKVSVWYLTNSFATLTLRSTISMEIISRIHDEPDIHLAFPTQSVYLDKDVRKPPMPEEGQGGMPEAQE